MLNESDLFYACSLIEYLGRLRKLKRSRVVEELGAQALSRIYRYADVLHSDSIEHVADEYVQNCDLSEGDFDNVAACRYTVPDYWTVGAVYARLVEDVAESDDVVQALQAVYFSWMDDALSNYNSDFYYQPRDYLAACYRAGEVLE